MVLERSLNQNVVYLRIGETSEEKHYEYWENSHDLIQWLLNHKGPQNRESAVLLSLPDFISSIALELKAIPQSNGDYFLYNNFSADTKKIKLLL